VLQEHRSERAAAGVTSTDEEDMHVVQSRTTAS
jgi:hypothetical protein